MRQLFIDSRDRVSGTTTDFVIQLREQLHSTSANCFRIDELRVPLVIPLVALGSTDTFYFTLGGVLKQVVLTPGNYSGTALATLLQAALRAMPSAPLWIVTYFNTTASLSIFCPDPTFHALTDAEVSARLLFLPTFASKMFENSYTYLPLVPTAVTGVTLTFSYCPVIAIDQFFLSSVRLGNQDTFGPNGDTATLMVAPVTSDYNTVLNFSMSADIWLNCPALTTSTLDFTLKDRSGRVVQGLPNVSFVLTLR